MLDLDNLISFFCILFLILFIIKMVIIMKESEFQELVKKHNPNEHKVRNAIRAFVIGGLIGAFGNFLINFYQMVFHIASNDASVLMITTLIFLACLFTALGFFDNFVNYGRMGVIIPITGFAHSVQSAILDYKKEGLIYGFGSNMFRLAGSVILYGVVSSYIFGIIRLILGGVYDI